jgi:CRP-like cAMP-binding protein
MSRGLDSAIAHGGQDTLGLHTGAVLKRLRSLPALSDAESHVLDRIVRTRRAHEAGSMLVDENTVDRARPRILISGWACRQRVMGNGRRVIFSFLVPGNILGAHFVEPKFGSRIASTVALTDVTVGDIPFATETNRADSLLDFAKAMSLDKSEAERLLHDQIMRVGGMSGMGSMAHLFLELHRRLLAVGLAEERWFPLPLSQEVLGDALGFTAVHVNRTLQQMRRENLISNRNGVVMISNIALLESLANGTLPEARFGMRSGPTTPGQNTGRWYAPIPDAASTSDEILPVPPGE